MCFEYAGRIRDAEEHGNAVSPGRDEANKNGTENGRWNAAFGIGHLLGHVSRRIQTGEDPIRADQTYYVCETVGGPACLVYEIRKHKTGLSMLTCGRRYGDEDDEKRHQRNTERAVRYGRQDPPKAVEKKREKVDGFIDGEHMPGFHITREGQKRRTRTLTEKQHRKLTGEGVSKPTLQ